MNQFAILVPESKVKPVFVNTQHHAKPVTLKWTTLKRSYATYSLVASMILKYN